MKTIIVAIAGLALSAGAVLAQSPSNATISGGQTAPANSAGASSAAAPTGQLGGGAVGVQTPQTPGDKAAQQPTTANSGSPVATTTVK